MSKLPKFNDKQLDKLADIFNNTGTVALGVLVIQALVSNYSSKVIIIGLLITFVSWFNVYIIMRDREGKS